MKQTIKKLENMVACIVNAYYKGRLNRYALQVEEPEDEDSAIIKISLLRNTKDVEFVCDGLKGCPVSDCGEEWTKGNVVALCYDPDEIYCPVTITVDLGDMKIDTDPDSLPEETLNNIIEWLNNLPSQNDVTSFMFYMWNRWCKEECMKVFGDGHIGEHIWSKWCGACDKMGSSRGAAEIFYAELSTGNRDKLVRRATECYEGMEEKK